MRRAQTVWVRNNGAEPFVDRFDGEDFVIEPGQAVEMLVECAELCLGFGEDDKTRCLRRKGWAFTHVGQQEGLERLDRFSFHMSEREALEHYPNKPGDTVTAAPATASSSAPARGDPLAAPKGTAGGVVSQADQTRAPRKPGPLDKLAQAQSAAG